MASFSSLFTSLTGAGFYYEKSSRHATYNFNQEGQTLYRNQPRLPFEYYINIVLNRGDRGVDDYFRRYFNNASWEQIAPLVKTVEMPAFKIETTPLNQYNRKRLSQTKIAFEPVKIVFHDVADGKTLKFWEMYYRYYFQDGSEPGMNDPKNTQTTTPSQSVFEQLKSAITPSFNPNLANLPSSVRNIFSNSASANNSPPVNKFGKKQNLQNIVSGTLDNQLFGFNLGQVRNSRNLIQSINIYQVHAGRFNQVTLVNPRISAFTHDVLNYAEGGKTLELTFVFEYEYAYYNIQNMKLGGNQPNNNSTIEQYTHGEFLELPALSFTSALLGVLESNNPLLQSDNPILQRIGKNTQASIGSVAGAFASDKVVRRVSASALDGLARVSPRPYHPTSVPVVQARSFKSTAGRISTSYRDVNRTGGNPSG